MHGPSAITTKSANRRKEQTGKSLRVNRKTLRSSASALSMLRRIYPIKTAIYLSQLTGAPIRTCEYWLEKDRLPDGAVWALLGSEDGLRLLIAGMGEARPRWFTWLLRLGVAGSVMRRRAADRRLLEQTLDADRELADTISRATTMAISDEEFHRPFIDALGSMARPSDGAVAAPAKGQDR